MKRTTIGAILTGVLAAGAFLFGTYVGKRNVINKMNSIPDYKEIETLIDSKDSIENQIDTVWIELNNVDQDYETAINTIINNAPDSNYVFFIEYIGSQKQRLDSVISDRR